MTAPATRGATVTLLLAGLLGLAGCDTVAAPFIDQTPTNPKAVPPVIPVLAGQGPEGPFRGVAYRTSDGWTCFEIIGGGSSSCGQGDAALLGMGWSTGGPNGGGFVSGGTQTRGAVKVRVLLDDGSMLEGSMALVPAPLAPPGTSVFAVPLPAGRAPKQLDVLDGAGRSLSSTEF